MGLTVRRQALLLPLILAVAAAYFVAFLLRFDFQIPQSQRWLFIGGFCIFIPVKALTYWLFRLHTFRWRLVGLFDLSRIALAGLTASLLACMVTLLLLGPEFPRSVYVIDAELSFLFTASLPFCVRMYKEILLPRTTDTRDTRSVLIYGAGTAGTMLCKEIRSNPNLGMRVIGFLDDDARKRHESLMGTPVLGSGRDAVQLVSRFARESKPLSEIIIAMPSATGRQMRTVIANCRAANIPFKTLPGVSELLDGKISRQIRNVSPNDLLGREPVRIDEPRIREAIRGESVLVTGGCGSIGSELCRQIASYHPRRLVIFDQAESEMFMLSLDLRARYPELELVTEVGDIVRASRVSQVITRYEVKAIFHAAAYKHVPLMEENVPEAVENNVIGTYNVVRAAHEHGVKKFVLISTDKAVNPTSVMGMTKRVAELIVSGMPLDGGPKSGMFVSVRFGNVLGSSGSVIPIFQKQIAAGGPVSVTHPEMRRYFMSISEAVQLVLQASTMGEGSEVFVLDMGEPVPIIDLARNMIRLAGFEPGEDIDIRITGLRPGEKLFEEIRLDGESVLPTHHEKIRRFQSRIPRAHEMSRWMESLRMLLLAADGDAIKAHLTKMVPEYQGNPIPAAREAHQETVEVTAKA